MTLIVRQASLFLMVTLIAGCSTKADKKPQSDPVKVKTIRIQKAPLPNQLSYSGTIEPDNTADIGFAVAGTVNNVNVQEGDQVQQGQLLASIDATEYNNALAIANASLEQAEDMYHRLNDLYQKGSLPAKDYIEIKSKLAQAQANKSINAKHIADSKLYAPISGIITARKIEKGSTAAPGIPAFTIIKTDIVTAKITVPESEVGAIRNGMDAKVYIATLEDTIPGKITIINPQADAVSRTYSVKIKLINSNKRLLPGMLTNVFINTGKAVNTISIPATAIVRDADDLTYVFVANEQHKAIRKRITAGLLTGSNEVVITSGLQEGDQLITNGQSHLKDGSVVIVE
ncbi:efflux RND transporter periplasmic adaptor subunit [Chitinophaga silvisoli]|uniref:Efflux RND transporter periplasmic adaptor subunit n=1 Tax=Chitinophaga silvisoli TaxID=2291814 RepID=A0A3E1P120_9BACT|nr:efflux RND transporter periplasmic adaptor subunit [Chitinophaga silvisoli]RFM33708.1 efflux RND transporter periplasmic adaptor subunit [Chitinophaga silvisoli]